MKKKRNPSASSPLTAPLRAAIVETGMPLLQLSNETGITRASLIRFRRGDTSLRLDVADRLADYLGLELVPRRKAK
jgi:hypothetical protein